jgi:hypothetical protein
MSENISNEIFKQKYLKYKSKYINLKNELKGGLSEDLKKYNTRLMEIFLNPIQSFTVHNERNFTIFFKKEEINFDFILTQPDYDQDAVFIKTNNATEAEKYTIDKKEIKVNNRISDLLDYTIFLSQLTNENNEDNEDNRKKLVNLVEDLNKRKNMIKMMNKVIY